MRERRHRSGNSNMPRPASACGDGAGSSTPTPSPRMLHRNGAATARRAEPAQPPQQQPEIVTKRRIHSARLERPRSSLLVPGVGRAVDTTSRVLPTLHVHTPVVATSCVEWAVKVAPPDGPVSASSKRQAPPTVPECELATVAPGVTVPAHLKPILKDFSALLRDRYDGKRSLRLAFLNWDRDKDGQLSLQEIRDMIHSLGLTKKLGHPSVEAIIDHVGRTPTQSLKYNDFCGYVYGAPSQESPTKKSVTGSDLSDTKATEALKTRPSADDDVVLSSDRALYPDTNRVVNILRRKYETRQLREVFRHWDTDKDGCVTLSELDSNLRRQGIKLPSHQLHELFAKHDANNDGRLLYQEFVEMIFGPVTIEHHNPALQAHLREAAKQQQTPPIDAYKILKNAALDNPHRRIDEEAICGAVQEKLKLFAPRIHEAYTAFDDDHNGNLSYSEFRQGLNVLGLHFTEHEFLHIAAMVDTDGSGEISFREFSNLFNRNTHRTATTDRDASCDPETLATQRATLSKGTFDFSHLTRRAKVPTRHGRTPYPNTKDLLSPTSQDGTHEPAATERFRTETSLYGSGQTPRLHRHTGTTATTPTLSLGQEEKQRKDANYAKRLERIRTSQDTYTQHAAPLQDAYETMQQRRAETLHRHQQRYQTSVEEHRPQQPQYSPQITRRARQPTVPPYINS